MTDYTLKQVTQTLPSSVMRGVSEAHCIPADISVSVVGRATIADGKSPPWVPPAAAEDAPVALALDLLPLLHTPASDADPIPTEQAGAALALSERGAAAAAAAASMRVSTVLAGLSADVPPPMCCMAESTAPSRQAISSKSLTLSPRTLSVRSPQLKFTSLPWDSREASNNVRVAIAPAIGNAEAKGGTAPGRQPVTAYTTSTGAIFALEVPSIFRSFFQSSFFVAERTHKAQS